MVVLNSFFAWGVGNLPIKKIARGDGQAWNLTDTLRGFLGLYGMWSPISPVSEPGGGVLAMLGYPGMCHFPGYTFAREF